MNSSWWKWKIYFAIIKKWWFSWKDWFGSFFVNYLLKGNIRILLKVITTRSVVEISSTENDNFLIEMNGIFWDAIIFLLLLWHYTIYIESKFRFELPFLSIFRSSSCRVSHWTACSRFISKCSFSRTYCIDVVYCTCALAGDISNMTS